MPQRATACDLEVLDRFLADRLSSDEQSRLEIHLDGCPSCRARLETLAAEPSDWVDARAYLSSSDVRAPVARPIDVDHEGDWPAGEPESSRLDAALLAFLGPTDDPRMLGRFGGYEIAGVIGRGGMGVVLKGLDVALNRYVAIKVLAPHLATSAAARERFAREARAAAAVVHDNVIAIHAVAEANGLPYLVMPYVRGASLQKRLDTRGPLAVAEILRIGMQVGAGLAAAHSQGLVHRDIKPANILLEDGVERLKITDFGLARAADDASLTRSGVIAGTPQFMSPEQARGESIDQRSDLFSLGSVLYAACTGHAPFRAETSFGVLRRITDDRPRPVREWNPEVPEWLAQLVEKLHSKNPDDRIPSADDVARLCEQCLAHVQQPLTVPLPEAIGRLAPPGPVRAPLAQRRRGLTAAVLTCLAIAAVWLVNRDPLSTGPSGETVAPSQPAGDEQRAGELVVPATPHTASDAWDDGAEGELHGLESAVERLEFSAVELWEPPTDVAGKEVFTETPAPESGDSPDKEARP